MQDTASIERWLGAYRRAWGSDAVEDIVSLFEPDARYFTAPFRDPYVSREEIARWWVENGDSELAWNFEYEVIAADGQLFVVKGVTTYPDGTAGDGTAEVYDNIWLVTLSDGGRASEFVEYWMLRD